MSLSEYEAEQRLAALRRQREALDREIADLVLYLELGRRLKGQPVPHTVPLASESQTDGPPPVEASRPRTFDTRDPWFDGSQVGGPGQTRTSAVASAPTSPSARTPPVPEPVAFADDPTGARQYGRALVAASCEIIAAAGHPLHAREIHDALIRRGFVIPGRDPVASLNTRLWKRAGDGGPLRRQGEAVYGLALDDPGET